MGSRLLRRSGVSVGQVCARLGWAADLVVQVGVGTCHQEVDVLREQWPDVRLIGFEPHHRIVESIRGSYPGDLHELAITNSVGTALLNDKRHHIDGSTLFPIADQPTCSQLEVKTSTLDELSSSFGICAYDRVLLWLDCEGSELNALKGASKFLETVDVINIEMGASSPDWPSPMHVHFHLKSFGFYRQWIHTHRIWDGQCDAVYVKKHLFQQVYCCDPYPI